MVKGQVQTGGQELTSSLVALPMLAARHPFQQVSQHPYVCAHGRVWHGADAQGHRDGGAAAGERHQHQPLHARGPRLCAQGWVAWCEMRRDTETEVLLLENDINTSPFTPAVHACVPPLPWAVTQADIDDPNRSGFYLGF